MAKAAVCCKPPDQEEVDEALRAGSNFSITGSVAHGVLQPSQYLLEGYRSRL